MPVLVALQHCHKIKQKYQTLIDNGKAPKVAIIANAIIKNQQNGENILLDYHRLSKNILEIQGTVYPSYFYLA